MLRIAQASDIPAMLDIYAPYVLGSTYTFEYDVPSVEVFTARFLEHTAQFPWLVWEEQGCVYGYAYAGAPFERAAYSWCAEVSIYLAPKIQGRGIGRTLYEALETILWGQGYRTIYALITTENTASVAFHEHLGYREFAQFPSCGLKFGRWLGIKWLQKQSDSVEIPMRTPTSWESLVKNHEKLENILAILSLS